MSLDARAAAAGTFRASLALLRTRRFGTFWFATLLSNIGTWAQQVAQPWLLLSLGASAYLIGLDAFAMSAPVFLLTLVGGVLADRADRRRVITLFQSLQMLCPVLVVALLLAGAVEPWMVIVLSLVIGVTDALSMPSYQSIAPSIVERAQIPAAIALNSTQFNLSRILGPTLAGLLMAGVGAAGAYAVSAASYLPFILVALWILPPGAAAPAAASGGRAPFAGIAEIAREPALRGALLTALATSAFCAPLITFCPVLVKEALHGDIGHFSTAVGAFGAGGLLGGLALLAIDPRRDRRPMSSALALAYAAVVALCALAPWAWALPPLFALAGAAMTASNASANALLQSVAPARIRGQTVSLFMLAMRGGVALGGLATGLLAGSLGVREALLLDALAALAAHAALRPRWLRATLPGPTS
jgi:MFS family permease